MVAIPKFVVNQLYVRGSLQQDDEGTVSFRFQSRLMSGHLTGVVRICVGEVCFGPGSVRLAVGDEPERLGHELSEVDVLWVPPQCELVIRLLGERPVAEGQQVVELTLCSRELGEFAFEVVDALQRA